MLLLKLVVEEYIRHIGPFDFAIEAVPFIADEERWNRSNWIAIEFNLLYRWHSLVPSTLELGGGSLTIKDTLSNSGALTSRGLGDVLAAEGFSDSYLYSSDRVRRGRGREEQEGHRH